MAYLILEGRLLGQRAVRFSSLLTAVPHRQYAAPSTVKQQATEAAAAAEAHSPLHGAQRNPLHGAHIKHITEMPGPRQLPIVGSFLSMVLDKDFKRDKIHFYWQKLKDKYGDIVRVDFPTMGRMVLLFHPDDCQHLSQITMKNPVRNAANAIKKIREDAIDNYYENKPGLLPSNNEEWYRVRSRVQAPMMKPKNITAYLSEMDQVALDFLDRIADFQKELGEMPSDFLVELHKWALESICTVGLNRRMGCLEPNLPSNSNAMTMIKMANNMLEGLNQTEFGSQIWKYIPTPAYIKMKRSHDMFLEIADENIKKTEAQLLAKDPKSEDDLSLMEILLLTPGLTRKDVIILILDMMFAGVDTTASSVSFTLYLLARNPEAQSKLQEEIDTVLGDHQGPLTGKHLGQLSYLKAVVKESFRMFPLVPGTARTLQEDAVFGGYLVPKGFVIGSWNMLMGGDERYFPRAKEFLPERWLRDRPLGPIHPYAVQPFGLGTRVCLGRRIAEQEIYTLLTRCLQRFNVDYKYQDMGITSRMVSIPSEPLRFNFTERR